MNNYYPPALLLARQEQATVIAHEARSALPDAPVVVEEESRSALGWRSLRGRIATALHRIAWAIES
ncbi:hypothetical protein EYS21_18340 [Arthrobacter sp. S39]|nr:hypothetical protein EYS21_18340 [Arthrobacter sp. S39]